MIGEPRIAAYVKPQKTGSQEQNESETKATDAPKQFEIEEIGKSEENETQNVLTNGSQMVSCQCPSSKRNVQGVF